MNVIDKIYADGHITTPQGEVIGLTAAISRDEGEFIRRLIGSDPAIKHTLEVGCAFGLSSLYICSAINGRDGASHTIIDSTETPLWPDGWSSVGIEHLKKAGYGFFKLIEDGSEFALPELAKTKAGTYDLIFIDGWHTFDHTMVDCFYATKLLRVGGYLVVSDAQWRSVAGVIAYLENYPCYERHSHLPDEPWKLSAKARLGKALLSLWPFKALIPRLDRSLRFTISEKSSVVALRKRAEDTRRWDWYEAF